ncbi:hypothetical protein F4779DRAFT_217213 [Xylariaceae sp. FL0662B]|nr:hypothetical protein F4779DRAFT_217213 [Xylariaceae sp. FL0662B]
MRGMNGSTLLHKKSKSSLSGRKSEERASHTRKWSTSSTTSRSSTGSHEKLASYDPLSLHPPLSLNTSPHIIPEYDEARYREEAERESQFFNQTRHAVDHIQDSTEYSPVKGQNCFFARPTKGRPYVYDQNVQWPLKDWQVIPPGLAAEADSSPEPSPSRPANDQRRSTGWMNDSNALIQRGEWKRRGIVFHLDSGAEQEQEQHYELPERESYFN